jgi:ATP-dependent Clp endopeptidase proteolytic subunit ClpP
MKRQFNTFQFRVENSTNNAVDIYIDGAIVDAETQELYKYWYGDDTSVSFKSFRNQVLEADANTYNVYINSYGGIVTDAMAIHDLLIELQNKGKTVNTVGRGIVASAATYILMAGRNAEMSKNSWFMVHNVSGFAWGDVNEVEKQAATLRKFNNATRDFYSDATGISQEEITSLMDAETWMTATEAKEKGFIKQVGSESVITNSIPKEHWQFQNQAILNAYNSAVKQPPASSELSQLFNNQTEEMKKFFQNIVDAIKGTKPAENSTSITGEQLAAAVQSPFEEVASEIENQISTGITNALAADATQTAITNAVNTAVTAQLGTAVSNAVAEAIKPFNQTIADQVKKIADLESEIANNKGGQSQSKNEDGTAPIGGFKKK